MLNSVLWVAEVMDKEPTLVALWAWALGLGGVGFLVGRWRWWAALPVLLVNLVFFYSVVSELTDSFVGPAIRREAGNSYVVGALVAGLVSLALPAAALLAGGVAAEDPPSRGHRKPWEISRWVGDNTTCIIAVATVIGAIAAVVCAIIAVAGRR